MSVTACVTLNVVSISSSSVSVEPPTKAALSTGSCSISDWLVNVFCTSIGLSSHSIILFIYSNFCIKVLAGATTGKKGITCSLLVAIVVSNAVGIISSSGS